jgi:hypothetical protein
VTVTVTVTQISDYRVGVVDGMAEGRDDIIIVALSHFAL